MSRPPASSLANAPTVRVALGEIFQAVLRGLPDRTQFRVQVREGDRWVSLGPARSSGQGRLTMPALKALEQGQYAVRMRAPDRPPLFIKILVTGPPKGG